MDIMYQAVKNLLKSLVNLFAAVLELFTNVINWMASCLRNFYPHISRKYAQIKGGRKRGMSLLEQKRSKRQDRGEEELMDEIRNQLKLKVTGKGQYYAAYFRLSKEGNEFLAMTLSVAGLILAGCGVVSGASTDREFRILILAVMVLVCIAACLAIHWHQRRIMKNRLIRHMLETEFRDTLWEDAGEAGTTQAVQDKGKAAAAETMQEKGAARIIEMIQDKGETGIIESMQEKDKERIQISAE